MVRFSNSPALLLVTLVVSATAVGCSRPPDTREEATPAASVAAPAATSQPAEEPAYEPAYPSDVSSEGLTEKDVEQQAKPHSHDGGEEHTHGEKETEGDHGPPH